MKEKTMEKKSWTSQLSFSCELVALVFFLVLSQFLIIRVPEIITQVFRPMIVLFLTIRMTQRGQIRFGARYAALMAAVQCALVLVFIVVTNFSMEELTRGVANILYLLMFFAVTGTPWTKNEVKFILGACFLACFVCAVVILLSNNPTDFHVGDSGNMKMFGITVNRNKNAYAFSLGTVLGFAGILYGKGNKKGLIVFMTMVIGYALMYSQCRGAFFCAVLGVTILVLGEIQKISKYDMGKAIIALFGFILFCLAAYYLLKNSELSRLIDGDSTSGRDVGIKRAWHLFLDTDWFGKLFGNGFTYEENHVEGAGAHLVYAGYLVSTGLVGCGFITFIFILSGLRIKGYIPYALFALAFLRTFFEGLDYYIYIPLILAIITHNYTLLYGGTDNGLFKKE